jgi:hypothetical protein
VLLHSYTAAPINSTQDISAAVKRRKSGGLAARHSIPGILGWWRPPTMTAASTYIEFSRLRCLPAWQREDARFLLDWPDKTCFPDETFDSLPQAQTQETFDVVRSAMRRSWHPCCCPAPPGVLVWGLRLCCFSSNLGCLACWVCRRRWSLVLEVFVPPRGVHGLPGGRRRNSQLGTRR